MSDSSSSTTGASTGSDGSSAIGVVNPTTPGTMPSTTPVNPAQASGANPVDISAMIAQYEQRIQTLMSEKNKAVHERNEAINAQVGLQSQLTELQARSSESLTATAQSAQTAIDQLKEAHTRITNLEGELLRASTLLQKPELAPYAQFIPVHTDQTKLNEAIAQLEQIRQQDLERNRATLHPNVAGTLPGQTTTPPPATATPTGPNLWNLYSQRTGLNPSLTSPVGSTPATMNPAGTITTSANIAQMLQEAMTKGPEAYQQALNQAKVLAEGQIQQELGRR